MREFAAVFTAFDRHEVVEVVFGERGEHGVGDVAQDADGVGAVVCAVVVSTGEVVLGVERSDEDEQCKNEAAHGGQPITVTVGAARDARISESINGATGLCGYGFR